jgi:hypothetical protein
MKVNNLCYILFYFGLFVVMGLFITPISTHLNFPFPLSATNAQIYHYWGGADPGSYALGGATIFTKGWLDHSTFWLLDNWPPGFMLLQATIMKVAGVNAPMVAAIQVLAALFLAITCNLFRLCIGVFLKKGYAALLPLVLLLFPHFRIFMLDRTAILLGETFAISFALTGFFCLILAYAKGKKSLALIAGFAFALSAYFRPTSEVFFMVASISFLLIFIVLWLYQRLQGKHFSFQTADKAGVKKINPMTLIFLALVMFHVCTLPYRAYTFIRTHSHSFSWVQDTSAIWQQNFTSSEALDRAGGGFEAQGEGNIACLVDKELCEKLSPRVMQRSVSIKELRKDVFLTLYKHPLRWLYLKYRILPNYWFASVNNFWDMVAYSAKKDYVENSVFLGCFIFSILWMLFTFRNPYSFIAFWLSSSIVIAYAVIFIFAHYEVRYFFFFKFFFLVTAIFGLVQWAARYPALRGKSTLLDSTPSL